MPGKDAASIGELVRLLDRTERLLVTFYYVERLTPAEIALVLDMSPNRVMHRLRTVQHRISDALAGQRRSGVAPDSAAADSDRSRSAASLPMT